MKLPEILSKIFKKKISKRKQFLIDEFEKGNILKIEGNTNEYNFEKK